MPWFRIDDGFYSSRKVTAIPRPNRWSAIGLWCLAGTWCAKELTDGRLPDYQFAEMGGKAKDAEALVAAGLWTRERDGYRFNNWHDYQPTRAEVEDARTKEAERKRKYRESVSQRDKGGTPTGRRLGQDVGHQQASGHPDPTRPDPTNTTTSDEVVVVQPKPALDSEFEEFWSRYPRKQGKADALKAFKAARKKHEAKALIDGAQAYALLNIGEEKSFLKLPAGWIRGERWNDEEIVAAGPGGTVVPFRQREAVKERFCPAHQGYPLIEGIGCLACNRDQETGTAF